MGVGRVFIIVVAAMKASPQKFKGKDAVESKAKPISLTCTTKNTNFSVGQKPMQRYKSPNY